MATPTTASTVTRLEEQLAEKAREVETLRTQLRETDADARSVRLDLEALLNLNTHRALLMDTSGSIIAVNRLLAESVGQSPRSMIGKSLCNFIPPELYEVGMRQVQTVIRTRQPVQFNELSQGQHFVYDLHPVMEGGEVVRIAVYSEDVSAAKREAAELGKTSGMDSVLHEIAGLSDRHTRLHGMLEASHGILMREVQANNFFVALIDRERDCLEFQYAVDHVNPLHTTVRDIGAQEMRRLSLLPIRLNDLVLKNRDSLAQLRDEGVVDLPDTAPESWLGIPLQVHGEPIGVMVIQDYEEERQYSERDLQLIRACADQIARNVEQLAYEELLRSAQDIFHGIPSGVFIYQYTAPDSLILTDANRAAEQITGISLKKNQGRELDDIWPEARSRGISDTFLTAIRTGEEYVVEDFTFGDKERPGIFHVQTFSLSGNRLGVTFEDVTEYKKAEEAIRKSEEYYRAFFEENHSIMLIIDPLSGRILEANHAAEGYYGYPREVLLSMTVFELNVNTTMRVTQFMESVTDSRLRRFIARHCLANGDERDVEVFSGPVEFAGQTKLISIVHDITDRLRAENIMAKAKETAEQLNKTKDEFLANISHEVRTPLNGIMGMLRLVLGTSLDEEQAGYAKTALSSSRSLLRVLNDVLDFTKIEAGRLELCNEPFELEELVGESVELFRQQADAGGLSLTWKIHEGTGNHFIGDGGRIRQVLFNLIGNGIKFTEEGHVFIETFVLPHDEDGTVRLFFSVKDSGIGIPDEMVDYIFESFSQVDGSLSRKHQGTGLGLPIVKRLVALMNGTISVDTELDSGTEVLFHVKVKSVEAPTVKAAIASDDAEIEPRRILLAEDEAINRIMAQRLLEKMGHSVDCAENGAICLEKLRANTYDLILMDVQMPSVNGLEATRAIRNDEEFRAVRDIPIIALTAHAAKKDLETALQAGMNQYLSKPFEVEELKRAIASLTNTPAHSDSPKKINHKK